MKNDLATAILTAIIGLVISYFVCDLLVNQMGIFGKTPTYPAIESTFSSELAEPNPEVFNYRAINPTVEVYVGDCTTYNSDGICVNNDNDTGTLLENTESDVENP